MSLFSHREAGVSWIIVFLGNPGVRYANTRHNAGFLTASALEKRLGLRIDRLKWKALTALVSLAGEKVLLMKPQTYMNLSGIPAREAMRFYKLPPERLLVVSDDAALPLGRLRVRRGGSAGGHNGLKDIIDKCGGDEFPRVKLGVGEKPPEMELADWVLSAFHGRELDAMLAAAEQAAECVECVVRDGTERAMNLYNGA